MTAATPTIGQVLGHYRIVEQIGAGGMGVVFRARDEQLDRDVALKTLPRLPLLSEPLRRQFRREALSLGKITDPYVAMAFDFGRDKGIDYLVTEYVPGVTLDAKLGGRPLQELEILQLGKQLASGLEAAHKEGVLVSQDEQRMKIFTTEHWSSALRRLIAVMHLHCRGHTLD